MLTRSVMGTVAALALSYSAHLAAHSPVGPVDQDTARAISFPDTAEHVTLVVDLHTHSVFSDGHVWPRIRVEEALRDGLDALAITEHLEYQPHRADIPHEDRNAAIREAKAAAQDSDLIIIAGSEITRELPAGHVNAVFIEDANKLLSVDNPPADPADALGYYKAANAWPAQSAIDEANAQQAFVFWNHPYWQAQTPDGIARMNDFHRANVKADKLHGIEIANGQNYSAEAHQIALDHDLALIGVSDVHNLIDWDYKPHEGGHRPVNLVLAEERSAEGIRDALFAGRTLVWFRNLLIARPAEMQAMLDASLSVTRAAYDGETQLLDVFIANRSDAAFQLQNLTDLTFMDFADHITIAPHSELKLTVKPGQIENQVALEFAVLNALTAPRQNPRIRFDVRPESN